MNEMDLLARMRDNAPRRVSPRVEQILHSTLYENRYPERGRPIAELKGSAASQPDVTPRWYRAPHRSRAPRRRRVLAAVTAVGATAAAVAAGLVIAASPRPAPAAGYSLDAFLTAAANAALAQHTPLPRPDQAFYEEQFTRFPWDKRGQCDLMWSEHPLTGVGLSMIFIPATTRPTFCDHFKFPKGITPSSVARVAQSLSGSDKYHLYPPLYSLPVRPAALRSALYAAAARGPAYWGLLEASYTPAEVVFTLAGRLLEGPVSGPLRAAVYQVIAGLPGVSLVQHATDAIGRHGVGIEMPGLRKSRSGPQWTELIIAPRTYRFLGMIYGNADWSTTYANIGSGLVTRPRT